MVFKKDLVSLTKDGQTNVHAGKQVNSQPLFAGGGDVRPSRYYPKKPSDPGGSRLLVGASYTPYGSQTPGEKMVAADAAAADADVAPNRSAQAEYEPPPPPSEPPVE